MVEIVGWIVVGLLIVIGMAGTVYPVLPGVIAVYAAFIVYGLFFSFQAFGVWFWVIQTFLMLALIVADYLVGAWGVKKYGGSRASIIGSTIGIIVGPIVIPVAGLIAGPFLGAVIGESFVSRSLTHCMKVGFGSVVGLLASIVVKIVVQLFMVILFILWLV